MNSEKLLWHLLSTELLSELCAMELTNSVGVGVSHSRSIEEILRGKDHTLICLGQDLTRREEADADLMVEGALLIVCRSLRVGYFYSKDSDLAVLLSSGKSEPAVATFPDLCRLHSKFLEDVGAFSGRLRRYYDQLEIKALVRLAATNPPLEWT